MILHYADALTLEWVKAYTDKEGRPPTAGQIARMRGWRRSSAVNWAQRMERAGWLTQDWKVRDA